MSAPGSYDLSDHLASMKVSSQDHNSEAEEVIHLQTPMEITPKEGSVCRIVSPTPFYVNEHKFWSASPVDVYASRVQLLISPTNDLGPGFLQGWSKLPDELKIKVLEFNLVYDEPMKSYLSFPHRKDHDCCLTEYSRLLRSTPEMATLSRNIYYTKNTFYVEISSLSHLNMGTNPPILGSFFAYPQPANNSLIRSLCFYLQISELRTPFFRRFQEGFYGFHSLRQLELEIGGAIWADSYDSRISAGSIRFGCKGSVINNDVDVSEDQLRRVQSWFLFGCSRAKCGVVAEGEDVREAEEEDDDDLE